MSNAIHDTQTQRESGNAPIRGRALWGVSRIRAFRRRFELRIAAVGNECVQECDGERNASDKDAHELPFNEHNEKRDGTDDGD